MADPVRETTLAIVLTYEAITNLRNAHPGHELLKFANTFDQPTPPEEFVQRYGGAHVPACFRNTGYELAVMYNNYCMELLAAVEDRTRHPAT